jgi:competence protein ComEC
VAEALLLGIKDDLDDSVSDAYSTSGTLHVLAVSGLHVALIFAILGKILHGLYSVRFGSITALSIQIGATWFYAVLSGFSPSIIRAAVMLSLISIGKNMKRRPSSGNMLLASAFFILIADPDSLFDLGFQLSYLAVTGIIYLAEPIENLILVKYRLLSLLWESASVTIAAQLFTTPLILYHFGRFPIYFLLANLTIVPWSSLILYAGGIFICLTDIVQILPLM